MQMAESQQGRTTMSDPVFGMVYDVNKVHFEQAPLRISQVCRDLRGEKPWVYAEWKQDDIEYFVLSSRRSEVSGESAVIRGNECAVGLPEWVLSGNDPRYRPLKGKPFVAFGPSVARGIASDLFKRYSAAFGGKRAFLDAVRIGGLYPDERLAPLRDAFESFAKTP